MAYVYSVLYLRVTPLPPLPLPPVPTPPALPTRPILHLLVKTRVLGVECRASVGSVSDQNSRILSAIDSASVVNSVTIGAELAVNIWNFVEPHNATVTTTATRNTCIPIIEDITVTDKGT